SRFGLVAFASSLDQIGPLARDVTDCALLLQAIAGHDPKDSTSAPRPVPDYQAALRRELKGIKVGLPREYMGQGIDPAVRQVVEQAARQLESLGAVIEETNLPHIEYAVPAYYLIATAEASSNLARYDGVRYGLRSQQPADVMDMFMHTRSQGFGAEVKRRIMLGTYALSAGYYDAYYLRAMKVRTLIRQDLLRALEQFDCLLCPATVTPAFKQGEKVADPLQMYLADITTIPVNLAGLPGIAVPAGQAGGLPVGIQLIGRPFGEDLLLGVAHAFEQSTPHHKLRPQL
ncbi:MAG: amidase family protein, partial [Bacillota bacterium]